MERLVYDMVCYLFSCVLMEESPMKKLYLYIYFRQTYLIKCDICTCNTNMPILSDTDTKVVRNLNWRFFIRYLTGCCYVVQNKHIFIIRMSVF